MLGKQQFGIMKREQVYAAAAWGPRAGFVVSRYCLYLFF